MDPESLDQEELVLVMALVCNYRDTLVNTLKAERRDPVTDDASVEELKKNYERASRIYRKLNAAYAQRDRA